jgi:hypothetical protein
MTSGRTNDAAVYIAETDTSFTEKVLSAGWQGNDLRMSFRAARNFFEDFLRYFTDPIRPQLDDNGDGAVNYLDGALAATRFLGRRYAFGGDDASGLPFILSAEAVENDTGYILRAELLQGVSPLRVIVQVIGVASDPNEPVEYTLTREPGDSEVWSAAITSPEAAATAIIYAAYPDLGGEKLSEPYFLHIGPDASPAGWRIR